MKKYIKIIIALIALFLICGGSFALIRGYITPNNKVAEPIPVFDTVKEPQTQQEYESMIISNCAASQEEYKKQYNDSIGKCDSDPVCIQKVKKQFIATESEDFVPACIQATVMNDEMSQEIIKGYAQQTQLSVYIQQAKTLSDTQLIKELKQGLTTLYKKSYDYDINLSLQMNAYLAEYYLRERLTIDPEITDLANSVLEKIGPCWGIPSGQCIE